MTASWRRQQIITRRDVTVARLIPAMPLSLASLQIILSKPLLTSPVACPRRRSWLCTVMRTVRPNVKDRRVEEICLRGSLSQMSPLYRKRRSVCSLRWVCSRRRDRLGRRRLAPTYLLVCCPFERRNQLTHSIPY
jgi:hypothetical protein